MRFMYESFNLCIVGSSFDVSFGLGLDFGLGFMFMLLKNVV